MSDDGNLEHFNRNYALMPWLALPYDQQDIKLNLKRLCCINGIPHLTICVVDDGTILKVDASTDLKNDDPVELYNKWLYKL